MERCEDGWDNNFRYGYDDSDGINELRHGDRVRRDLELIHDATDLVPI